MPKGTGTQAASSVETPSGIFQANAWGDGAALGVRAVDADGDGPVAHREALDVRPDLGDRARALVADDVRRSCRWRHPSRLSVSPPSMLTASTSIRMSPGPATGSGTSS